MKLHNQKSAPFGEVVAAVFDKARSYGKTPSETSRLASLTVMHLWLKNHPVPIALHRAATTTLEDLYQ